MLKLLIARHGNTFDKGDEILRVGFRTDLPLSISGRKQSECLGQYLKMHYPDIDTVYCSELRRTQETADIALKNYPTLPSISAIKLLNEIDYGEDDGQPESEVIRRLGQQALDDWEGEGILPQGWLFNKEKQIEKINDFAKDLIEDKNIKTVLLVTSNGIARFFRSLLNNENSSISTSLKLGTGCLGSLTYQNKTWSCEYWNLKPEITS